MEAWKVIVERTEDSGQQFPVKLLHSATDLLEAELINLHKSNHHSFRLAMTGAQFTMYILKDGPPEGEDHFPFFRRCLLGDS
jgi:hypothetical protein